MTKYFMTLAMAFCFALTSFAQTTPSVRTVGNTGSDADYPDGYETMIKNMYKVELRSVAIDALDLTSEDDINEFTEVYLDYMREKENLMNRRKRLVEEHRDEMAEDNSMKSEKNEIGDFIENFLELNIDEMELQKDYFDVLEDEIGPEKALKFFAMEDMYAQRARRKMVMEMLPDMTVLVPTVHTFYEDKLNQYNNWNRIRITGNVDYDHNYTYNGLSKLWNAAEAMAMSEGITVNNLSMKKQKVMNLADQMKQDWRSLKHADYARQAFQMTATTLAEIAGDSRFNVSDAWLSKLNNQANMIKADQKLTNQSTAVNNFFDTAEYIVNDLVQQADAMK